MKTAQEVCLAIEEAPDTDALLRLWQQVAPFSTSYTMEELATIIDAIQRRSAAASLEPRTDR